MSQLTSRHNEIFNKFAPFIGWWITKKVRGYYEPTCPDEDLSQACFLAVWERIIDGRITAETPAKTIRSLARNTIAETVRASALIRHPRGKERLVCVSLSEEDTPDTIIDDDDLLGLIESWEEVDACSQSDRQRECLSLLMDGYSGVEVAKHLDVSSSWVTGVVREVKNHAKDR